jgi:hypothetical protein
MGEEVKGRTKVINLAVAIGLAMLLSIAFSRMTFHLSENASVITLFCISTSVAYPMCLRATKAEIGYLRELLILAFVFVIAFGVSELVYYSKMEPVHHDSGEALPILGFYVLWWGLIAVLSYSIAFLGRSSYCVRMRVPRNRGHDSSRMTANPEASTTAAVSRFLPIADSTRSAQEPAELFRSYLDADWPD